MSYTLGACVPNLVTKMQGRQNLASALDGSLSIVALTQALQNLTETFEFEELKYQSPVPPSATLSMTQGSPYIPIATVLATAVTNAAYPQFENQNLVDITDIYTFWMWFSGGVNQAGRSLKYRRVTTIDNQSYGITSNTTGQLGTAPPVYYTRFGQTIQVGPVPDQAYNYFMRVKLRHPFPVTDFADQVVFMPDSWQQALEYLACYNISLWEGAAENIQMFTQRLLALGVDIKVLKLKAQMERDELHNERALSLRNSTYTWR
jgi:hypothetical protein